MPETQTIDSRAVLEHLAFGDCSYTLRFVKGLGHVPYLVPTGNESAGIEPVKAMATLEEAVTWLGRQALVRRRTHAFASRWELELVQLLGGP